ncbi:MAG: T9SS type A sorting domain-containing protein [Saprospiraceae bacterium]|nr:T9SS type A sorting domain-containing protein [Saprospiraceae bacterium]
MNTLFLQHFQSLILVLGMLSSIGLTAQPGTLDPTFGQGGRVNFAFDTPSTENDPTVVAVQADGKIVVAGRAFHLPGATIPHVGIARLMPNGDLDPGFSGDGKAGFLVDPAATSNSPRAMRILPDGKILMIVSGAVTRHYFLKLLPNGEPDPTFGVNGVVKIFSTMEIFAGQNFGYSMEVQTNGKILMAHRANYSAPVSTAALIVARFQSNGLPDNTFGTTGRIAVDSSATLAPSTGPMGNVKMALLSGNKILLAGDTVLQASPFKAVPKLIRLNTNGGLDGTFGMNGQLKLESIQLSVRDLKMDAAQNIFLSGESGGDRPVVKIAPNGLLDSTFGTNGVASGGLNFSVSSESSLVLSNGNPIVGGLTNTSGFFQTILKGFDSDGLLDPSFGIDGISLIPQIGDENVLRFMTVQADGKIIIAAKRKVVSSSNIADFEVIRLNVATSATQEIEEKTTFQCWPNPVVDQLHISLTEVPQGATLSLYSAEGKWLNSQLARDGVQDIDLNGHPAGLYFLQLNIPGGKPMGKIVFKR